MPIEDYRELIDLDISFSIKKENKQLSNDDKNILINKLLEFLCSELDNKSQHKMYCKESSSYEELRAKVRALLTVRSPLPLPDWFNDDFDKILQNELLNRDLVDTSKLPTIADQFTMTQFKDKEKCVLWRGDISLLQVDAIVNAANSAMLGCFIPFHNDCNTIIKKQDCFEEVGWAKITRAYNLPSIYVIHTYGPDLSQLGKVGKLHEKQLANCYRSCLDEASKIEHLKSIAFCGISTGVFAFPIKLAAEIAIRTVENWLKDNPDKLDLIIFDVYSESDYEIYKEHFESWNY
ncbi:MAG: macro domain-containing protein [Candidatus Heimdallarchaeota archaeon]